MRLILVRHGDAHAGFHGVVGGQAGCTGLTPPAADSTARKDEDEDIEPRTFTLDEARRLVDAGEIVDLKTALGLTML